MEQEESQKKIRGYIIKVYYMFYALTIEGFKPTKQCCALLKATGMPGMATSSVMNKTAEK